MPPNSSSPSPPDPPATTPDPPRRDLEKDLPIEAPRDGRRNLWELRGEIFEIFGAGFGGWGFAKEISRIIPGP